MVRAEGGHDHGMTTDEQEETTGDLAPDTPSGDEGLNTGSAPQEGISTPDVDAAEQDTSDAGDGHAD